MEESNFDKVFPDKARGNKDYLFLLSHGFSMVRGEYGKDEFVKAVVLLATRRVFEEVPLTVGTVTVSISFERGLWQAVFLPETVWDIHKGKMAEGNSPMKALEGIKEAVMKAAGDVKRDKIHGNGWEFEYL